MEITVGKKEKLLVTSNFSFSHSVFKRHVLQTRKNQGLFGKGLRRRLLLDKICRLLVTKKKFFSRVNGSYADQGNSHYQLNSSKKECGSLVKPTPDDKILTVIKFKAFADDDFNVA